MGRRSRGQEFLFEPAAFLNDPSVLQMNHSEVGAYMIMLCNLWFCPEPGVCPSNDVVLSRLARATEEDWVLVKDSVARAFDTKSRPGFWIQKRMVETHTQQSGYFARQVLAGSKGGKAKALNKKARLARGGASSNPSGIGTGIGIGTGTGVAGVYNKPSLEEVKSYCLERKGIGKKAVDAEAWYDHYESNGWIVGKTRMRDWRASVRTWERSQFQNGNGKRTGVSGADLLELGRRMKEAENGEG